MSGTMRQKLLMALAAALLATVSIHAGAASLSGLTPARVLAGPCAPGGAYDPACDVDHDGDVDIFDIQLAAGHWGQAGPWSSGSWDLTGNAATAPGTHFVGTTDNQPLELKVNNQRALRLEPHTTSPNLVGGHSSNSITPGVYGATISGGGATAGPNAVGGTHGTVSGGYANSAGGPYATVGGGYVNLAPVAWTTIGGGSINTASGTYATVSGGFGNTASGPSATVSGGGSDLTLDFGYQYQPGGIPASTNTISGVLWNDQDGDGVFDVGEPMLTGVSVVVDCGANGTFLATTGALVLGRNWSVAGVPDGSNCTITPNPATLPLGYTPTTVITRTVTNVQNDVTAQNFGYHLLPSSISGTVITRGDSCACARASAVPRNSPQKTSVSRRHM